MRSTLISPVLFLTLFSAAAVVENTNYGAKFHRFYKKIALAEAEPQLSIGPDVIVGPPLVVSEPLVVEAGSPDPAATNEDFSAPSETTTIPDLPNVPFNTANPGAAIDQGVTVDGTCGPNVGFSCVDENGNPRGEWGPCCSTAGYCGNSDDYCITSCDPAYGLCFSPPSTSISTPPPPSPTPPTTQTQPGCLFNFDIPQYCGAIPDFDLTSCDYYADSCAAEAAVCREKVQGEYESGGAIDVGSTDGCAKFESVCTDLRMVCNGMRGLDGNTW
ncbi:hypothetical protein EJ08DRAFT_721230 [Tothia fuscella]|uniref:Chitin-binding type-1 domain-containing protein n=1 Tax=Tothia fuscella TaxID=1048955 RepID=A0A9P4TVX0_9PEZI|nr:hypothetical protein EJ08DRAFT_721230 [Tothia fuscella]